MKFAWRPLVRVVIDEVERGRINEQSLAAISGKITLVKAVEARAMAEQLMVLYIYARRLRMIRLKAQLRALVRVCLRRAQPNVYDLPEIPAVPCE